MAKLPEDPLIQLERDALRGSLLLGAIGKRWIKANLDNTDSLPPLEIIAAIRESRECLVAVEKLRLARQRLFLEQRKFAGKLPSLDDSELIEEAERMLRERLGLISSQTLYALAREREKEENMLDKGNDCE